MKNDSSENIPSDGTASFATIIGLCESFAGEANESSFSTLDSCLAGVGETLKPVLLRNLLAITIKNRRAAGEQPQAQEYIQRFPQFAELIRNVFLDSVDFQASVQPKIAAVGSPAVSRLGDYRILGELGRGGMGVVYEAIHIHRGNRVALKTLPLVDGATLHGFKREFRVLADVNHPNLIGLHTLEADASQWFFTMDLVEGMTFLKYVRPNGVLDEPRLRSALSQLVRGVMALHGQHIIHRDLKPSNVMVTSDGHLVVLDFGLALGQDSTGFTHSLSIATISGTPRYMAPEQAAGEQATPASDWYAVGVMLYEALSGVPPFSGPLLQVLQDKQRRDAPPLPGDASVAGDLAGLCLQLLAREPRHRPDAFEIAKSIAPSLPPVAEAVVPSGQRLVGREPQLAALRDVLRTIQHQQEPQTVFVSGRSGEGKTTLGEHFLAPLRKDKSLVVMSGRCYDRESVPFKALDALIDALGSYLRSLPGEDAALLLPDDIGVLAQVFPVLERVEVVAKRADPRLTGLDEQQVRQRAFRALRLLLSRISRRSLTVWFIDDLQWGDADSAQALFEVLRPPGAPAVLFLGTYRSDETEGSAFLKTWKELQAKHEVRFADREVKVAPLTVEECTELVIGLVGKDDGAIRRRAAEFAQETRGNPFLLIELIGCFDADTDSFEPLPLHEVLARKLGRLPAEAAPFLEVVAVSGQGLSLEEAWRTAGHALAPIATITRMRNERLVRLIGGEERPLVDTYHDRVRETILSRMDDRRCQTLHGTLAEVIEGIAGGLSAQQLSAFESGEIQSETQAIPRVFDLAYHFDAAGDKRKAWSYGLLAAEQARRQSALEVAANNYDLAQRNAVETTPALRYRIAEGWGESLMLLGRYEDAKKRLDGVIDLVDDAERKARIEVLLGEIAFKQGAISKSIEFYERGLRRLGYWVPRSRFGLGMGILKELLIQCWHSLVPGRLHRSASNRRIDLSIRISIDCNESYMFQNTPKFVRSHFAGMNLAERLPPSTRLTRMYALHAMFMSMLGWQERFSRYSQRSHALLQGSDDLWLKAHCHNAVGIGHYAVAGYEEGLACINVAIEAYEKAGDLWDLNVAHFHRGCCYFGLGNLAEAVVEARWTFASSTRLGDSRTLCSSYLWARSTRGNLPFEQLKSCYPCRPDDIMSTVHGIMAEGHWHRFHGRTAESLQMFEQAGELIWKSLCVNSHMIVLLPELAAALRLHAETVGPKDPQQAELLRRRAYRLAKWAARITRFFPAAYPLSLRELSLMLSVKGKLRKALEVADRSCSVADAQKARFEHAQSLLVRGRIAHRLGRPEAEEQIRTAEAALDAMENAISITAKGHEQLSSASINS